jgi:phage terminase large subunit-like protein
VVAARLRNKRFCVLADRTIRGGPSQWARAAVNAYREFKADTIVAETNYGGAMVMHTIKTEDRTVPVKIVTATRGKVVRAEPISTLYARGEIDHAGTFAELEDQAVNMTTAGYMGERSPDRVDAMVWALTELSQAKTFEIRRTAGGGDQLRISIFTTSSSVTSSRRRS